MPLMLVVGTINKYPPPAAGWDVVHIDRSDRGIWDATQGKSIPIDVQADMRQLPYQAGSVDRIQSWHALEHVNEQGGRATIREFARVLRPGGILDIRVPDLEHVQKVDDVASVLKLIYGDQSLMSDAELNVHKWGYTERTLRELLADQHFEAERIEAEYPDEIHLLATLQCS
jgi:predicted SAM-dependent methyltransferase